MKKALIYIFCIILILVFFHNFFIHKIFQIYLEKITEKNIKIESVNINFISKTIVIRNIQVFNDPKFQYKSVFFCNEITSQFKYSNLFRETILIEEIKFKDPIIYIEIIEKKNKSKNEDNISVLEKKQDTYVEKIYPKKAKDRNIIFKSVKILNPQANLTISKTYKYENFYLSDMKFNNVGTSSTKSTHFKKIFKTILSIIYIQIPNIEIQKKLREFYMS